MTERIELFKMILLGDSDTTTDADIKKFMKLVGGEDEKL